MPTINKKIKIKKTRNITENMKSRQEIYNTDLWRRLRDMKRMNFPLCEVCNMEGKITPVSDIHHLISFTHKEESEKLRLAYDYDNLISVCKPCHIRLHQGDLKGCRTLEDIANRLNLNNKIAIATETENDLQRD